MQEMQTDVVIIGAGTAGLNARRAVERAGRRWVLVEAGPYGTTCARVGCMPSKLLIAAADAAHGIHEARQFGIHVAPDQVHVDGREVLARVRRERDRFAGFVVESTEALDRHLRVQGHARFVDARTIQVGDHTRIHTHTTVLATGSSPWIPGAYAQLGDAGCTSDAVFNDWEDLPASVAVMGTGIIGLELGQALHQLGVHVRFFDLAPDFVFAQDPEVQEKMKLVWGDSFSMHLGCTTLDAQPAEGGARVTWKSPEGEGTEIFEKVLVATGRRPNLSRLDLDKLGVQPNNGVWPIDPDTLQLGDLPIFVAGDATNIRPLLHEASDEGQLAGSNAASYPGVSLIERRTRMAVAFTTPQFASVGTPVAELDGRCVATAEVSYDDQGRSRVHGVNTGLVRLWGDVNNRRLMGAEMFGPRMEHMAHTLAWAIQARQTVDELLKMPFYHPVFEEGLRTGLRALQKAIKEVCARNTCGEVITPGN